MIGSISRREQYKYLLNRRNYSKSLPMESSPLLGNDFSPRTEAFPLRQQGKVIYDGPKSLNVGFVLARQPVIMPDIHPVEHELSNLLQGEYNIYNRHRVGFELDEVASQGTAPKISGKKAKALTQCSVKRNIALSSQNFWKERGVTLDQWGRQEDRAKKLLDKKDGKKREKNESTSESEVVSGSLVSNFYNLEGYADGQRTVANNWRPNPRVTIGDQSNTPRKKELNFHPASSDVESRRESITLTTIDYAARHTTHRKYEDFLYHIVQYAKVDEKGVEMRPESARTNLEMSAKWSIPYGQRKQGESIRATLDRLLIELTQKSCNIGKFSFYVPSNAPQGVFYENGDPLKPIYVFIVYYVEEHRVSSEVNTVNDPSNIMGIDPINASHMLSSKALPIDFNWVSRAELQQYSFCCAPLQSLLNNITISGSGE